MSEPDEREELIQKAWALTVERVKPMSDVGEITEEWMKLAGLLARYYDEAVDRAELHTGSPGASPAH